MVFQNWKGLWEPLKEVWEAVGTKYAKLRLLQLKVYFLASFARFYLFLTLRMEFAHCTRTILVVDIRVANEIEHLLSILCRDERAREHQVL